MGYDPRTIYKLIFDEGRHEGLVVRMRATTLRDSSGYRRHFAEITELQRAVAEGEVSTEEADKLAVEMVTRFADLVVDWNLEIEGVPVPPTAEGFLQLEWGFLSDIIAHYMLQAGFLVAPPLETPSSDGADSEIEASMTMETLSPSLAS